MRFPLEQAPAESWHVSPRKFGANRANGRKHAGCDLYAKIGTPVLAVADGVVKGFTEFYRGTWALTVDHGEFWIRYGEIDKKVPATIHAGAKINEGDQVGFVGDLIGLSVSMLHLEMYAGTATGALTVPASPPFMRRADLIDPTAFLDELSQDAPALLASGASGDEVREWQRNLLAVGYAIAVDGQFGPDTIAATGRFQAELGVPVSGTVSEPTMRAMSEALKP